MTEAPAQLVPRRWWKYGLLATAVVFVAVAGFLLYLTTDSFQSLVRRRMVEEIERITGGRAQIASIHTVPFRLQVEVRNVTVRGSESQTVAPLAHADAINARFKIISLLRSELAFDQVILDHPVVHVIVYPNGNTNFPPRTVKTVSIASRQNPVEKLFALSINRFELRHGEILWDNQEIPLDFTARDTSLQMDYSFLSRRYDGRLLLGQVETKLLNCKPFAWMTAMEFILSPNSAVISSLQWNSGHSHVSASGQVTDFRGPHLQGPYQANFDLAEVASIARRRDLHGGLLNLKGHGDWSLDHFSANGLLTLDNLSFQDDQVSFSKASLATGYSVSDQQLKLSKLQGKIFGGSFDGEAEVDQWLAPSQRLSAAARKTLTTATISALPSKAAERNAKPKPAFQIASGRIHLRDLSANDLAAGLDTPAHPFPQFHPAALASGTFETRWQGTPRDAEIQFDVDLNPFPEAARGQLAIAAHADGIYHAATDSLDLPRFTLATPTSHLQASGTLSSSSTVRLSVTTSSLAEWLPFISVVRGPELFPVTLNGSATFNGSMTGSLSAPRIFGNLSAENFDLNVPATRRTHAMPMHWDSLSTFMQVSFDSITLHSGKLVRDGTAGAFDGSASLDHGHITGDSSFTLRANLYNANLATLQALAGFDYPVAGAADVKMQAGGTFSDPHADGEIHLTNAAAYGQTIRQFDSSFHVDPDQIAFSGMHLFHEDSVINGDAAYHPLTRAFSLNITGSNLDLARIPELQVGRIAVEGHADFALKATGTPESPSINGNVHIHSLALDHQLAGDFNLQASTENGELHLTGSSEFQRGSLALRGDIALRDNYPTNVSFQMDQLDLDPVLHPYLDGKLTAHSAADGSIDLSGPLWEADDWVAKGNLSGVSLAVANIKVQNQDPVLFSIEHEALGIKKLHLAGDGTDFTAYGTVQLSGTHALDLTADGRADLKLLSMFDPNFTASGPVSSTLTVSGTFADPLPQGHIHVANSAISYAGVPSGLTDLNGSLLFTRDHLQIDSLAAHTGGGTVDLKGDATLVNRQLNFNLTGSARDVRLRYPPGVSSTADAQLNWVGTRSSSTVSGQITVNKIAVTPGFDFSSYLDRTRQLTSVSAVNSPLSNIKLDIHIQTAPELQMRTAIARLSGDADLHIRGSIARPAVLGRADILEGQATFHGTRFTLERGDITFANPVAIEPQLNLQASTRVRDYDLDITITGSPDRGLNINYRSDPPLPKSDIIALLALGRGNEESAQFQGQSSPTTYSDEATAQILSQALNTTVGNRLQRLFGASNIKIDPQGLTTETNPISNGPQITIEQQFVNHITVLYSTNVSQTSEQIIQGEYYVNRNVSAVGMRDQNGVVSFDLRARTRKK
ncbi:MAG: translocation/assembly module TamB domain-containing protein [Candidatus Sulfotelmatobacter sp.]